MSTSSSKPNGNLAPIRVEIAKTVDGYRLLRGGQPYAVRGAGMAGDDIARFAAAGGNSIRNWNTLHPGQDMRALLDAAHAHDVTVALGLPMRPERHGFDYDNAVAVATQFDLLRDEVLKYREHPAVLAWIIGNELNHDYRNPRVYDAVNEVAAMIHELDPWHPATTTTSGFSPEVIAEILARAPALDFISFQLYAGLFGLPERLAEIGFDAPFMVTEWGTIGYWETQTTDWGAPIELHSSAKADTFLRAWRDVLTSLAAQLLGSYAFYWGQKQERTPTWFGMLTADGDLTEVVDTMQYAWTGAWPADRTPRVAAMLLNGRTAYENVRLVSGQRYAAEIRLLDADGDGISYRWELKPESTTTSGGGDYEAPPPNLDGLLASPHAATTLLTAPAPGKYRLFAYANNAQGRVAHANIPFLVEPA